MKVSSLSLSVYITVQNIMQRELTPWNWILKVLKFQNEMYKQGSKSRWKNSVICLVIMFIPTDVRVFQISVRGGGGKSPSGGGIGNFTGGDFFTDRREPEEERFWRFEPFSKLNSFLCKYWTSIKTKINMTCVPKEYKIRTKLKEEQWPQLKMLFLLGYNLKIVV